MLTLRHLRRGRVLDRQSLACWSQSAPGQRLLDLEVGELQRQLPDVFGRHLLQIGNWAGGSALLQGAETLHRAVLGTLSEDGVSALIDPQHLPLPAKSIDAVLLPHTLEFCASPHAVLRETARVLNDRGKLFILGFNPLGARAWRNRLGLRGHLFPPGAHFYGAQRLADWLQVLDFEVADLRRFSPGFPWLAPRSSVRPYAIEDLIAMFAENYLLVARKRVLPINFIGRTQRAQVRSLVGVATPAAQRQGVDTDPKPSP